MAHTTEAISVIPVAEGFTIPVWLSASCPSNLSELVCLMVPEGHVLAVLRPQTVDVYFQIVKYMLIMIHE